MSADDLAGYREELALYRKELAEAGVSEQALYQVEAVTKAVTQVMPEFADRRISAVVAPLIARIDALEAAAADALRFRGVFSRALTYARNDLTQHAGTIWLAVQPSQNQVPEAPRTQDACR